MCGRFTQLWTWAELHGYFAMFGPNSSNFEPEYNIAPTREIWVLLPGEAEGVKLSRARWGLVPAWWKKTFAELPSAFNARSETVAEKPFFRSAFKTRRCIVPVSGFYEWTGAKGARKPHYFTRRDGKPMFLAALFEEHVDPETGEHTTSTVVLTCPANATMEPIHDRMPVILEPDQVEAWIAKGDAGLMRPAEDDVLQEWPVDPQVNSSRYQGSDATDPYEEMPSLGLAQPRG